MLGNRPPPETGRWTVLILIILLALAVGTVVSTLPVTAQSGNASESTASTETATNTTPSAQTATNRASANSTASPTSTPSSSSFESPYADIRPDSAPAQSGSPTATPTATPTSAATSTPTPDRSQPPNETANASVGGGPSGGEPGGSESGVSASESGGIGGIAGLSPMMLLLGGVMAVLAVAEMIVVGGSPSRWFQSPAFSGSLPLLSAMVSRGQSEQREEDDAVESADIHDENEGQPSLTAIQQVGDDRASTLREAGFESVEDVATASQNALTDIEGIGGARGEAIAESANSLLDDNSSETVDDSAADTAEDGDTHSGAGEAADSEAAGGEGDEEQMSVVANARASLAEIARRVYGHTRMLFDRRALEPRAYGATDDWTALTFDCSNLAADSEPVRELLEETVYIGEVPVEIAGEATNRPERRLSAESSVRVPREGIEQVERAAQADNPEAKRTVTLLRRALRAEEERAIRGSGG
jgi:cytoskeletal protein RodZ